MFYDRDLSFIYYGPTRIVFGINSSRDIQAEIEALGCRRAVLVTDPGITKAGLLDRVVKSLGPGCAGVFSDVPQDTGIEVVNAGAAYARRCGADAVVSLGGGSVIDTAKGMCVLLKEGGKLEDFEGVQLLTRWQTPHVVIPTTAGTGSEVTCMAVVLDKRKGQKIFLLENYNTPRTAILDPALTEKLPPLLTASTGMDAMCHAVEALHSIQREPITDGIAMHAIRLLVRNLPICVNNGSDLAARGQMQIAATMAGWAFNNSMVSIVHAMAHSIGAVAGVPHGIANGILLPFGMEYNLPEAAESYALAAEALGTREKGMGEIEAAESAIRAVREFTVRIRHPQRLSEAGVSRDQLAQAAELSVSDGAIIWNPRPVPDSSDVLELFQKAF